MAGITTSILASALAEKDVKFILTVLSAGSAIGDRMLWVGPIIVRMNTTPPPIPSETATPFDSLTATAMSQGGTLSGRVLASKSVTIQLYDGDQTLTQSGRVNTDGTFSFEVSRGSYSVVATAPGFLSAQGFVMMANGNPFTFPSITLIAGDIDNNDVIDQFDALTIGMSYNTAVPSAADFNDDGIINVLDLELLAKNYRTTGPLVWQ